ncbi:MAG: PIG-L family deacetylase [Nanoarchaeota archaeon]
MPKGLTRAFLGSSLNMLMGRTIRHKFHKSENMQNYHFIFAHSDDELAVLKPLKIISSTYGLNASFTLLSNGTQGYEPNSEGSREDFGRMRVKEFNRSLVTLGFEDQRIKSLLDEREIYEMLVREDSSGLNAMLERAQKAIARDINLNKPKAVFVDDFAGGNIVHDIANYITHKAAKQMKFSPVIEYWQYFFDKSSGAMIVGDLGHDEQGRILRDNCKGKYDVEIPALGIHKGRMFLSPFNIIGALRHKQKVYSSQEKTLKRLTDITFASYGIDAPHFRELCAEIDYTKRPSHGVLYEGASWRLRGLPRLPTFEDFARMVRDYEKKTA